MPHITLQIGPSGPVLDLEIGVSQAREDALKKAGQPVPPPLRIRGLIDTGASCTCVDPLVLGRLQLTPTGKVAINTPSTGSVPHTADQYDVSLILMSSYLRLLFPAKSVVESHLSIQGIDALIGRDILEKCLLVYDGQAATFTLAF